MRIALISVLAACLTATVNAEEISEPFKLQFLAGEWIGKNADGRFEEHTSYGWNDENTYLELSMAFFVEGEKTGEATGYMLTDETTGGLIFSIITSDGVVISQKQLLGGSENVEMAAISINGSRAGMPPEFRTRIRRYDDDHYWTELLMLDGDTWKPVMENEFERQMLDNVGKTVEH